MASRGLERYRQGHGNGGRYMPAGAIRLARRTRRSTGTQRLDSNPAASGKPARGRAPHGELLSLAGAYRDGQITLADLARQLRGRRLAAAPLV